MRWLAGVALVVALFALGLQLGLQMTRPLHRYQVVASSSQEGTGSIIRLDTETGELVAFVIGTQRLVERARQEIAGEGYGSIEILELARRPK